MIEADIHFQGQFHFGEEDTSPLTVVKKKGQDEPTIVASGNNNSHSGTGNRRDGQTDRQTTTRMTLHPSATFMPQLPTTPFILSTYLRKRTKRNWHCHIFQNCFQKGAVDRRVGRSC